MSSKSAPFYVVYEPPPGSTPFEFVYSSTTYTIQPPDGYWKKVPVKTKVGDILHPTTGKVLSEKFTFTEEWVPDPVKTATGKRPTNGLYVTEAQWTVMNSGAYDERKGYLRILHDEEVALNRATARVHADHQAELGEIKRAHVEKAKQLVIEAEKQADALREQIKTGQLAAVAAELGIDPKEMEALAKARKKSEKRATE